MIDGSDQPCSSFFNFMHQHLPEIGYADRIWCHSLWLVPVGVCCQLKLSGDGRMWLYAKISMLKPDVIQLLMGTSWYYMSYFDSSCVNHLTVIYSTTFSKAYLNKNTMDEAVNPSTKHKIKSINTHSSSCCSNLYHNTILAFNDSEWGRMQSSSKNDITP